MGMRKHAHCLAHCESGEGHSWHNPLAPPHTYLLFRMSLCCLIYTWHRVFHHTTPGRNSPPRSRLFPTLRSWPVQLFLLRLPKHIPVSLAKILLYRFLSLYLESAQFLALTFKLLEERVLFVLFWLLVILHIIGLNKFLLLMISEFLLKVTFDCVNSIIEPYRMSLVFLTYKIAVPYPSHRLPKPWPQAPFLVTYLINCDI